MRPRNESWPRNARISRQDKWRTRQETGEEQAYSAWPSPKDESRAGRRHLRGLPYREQFETRGVRHGGGKLMVSEVSTSSSPRDKREPLPRRNAVAPVTQHEGEGTCTSLPAAVFIRHDGAAFTTRAFAHFATPPHTLPTPHPLSESALRVLYTSAAATANHHLQSLHSPSDSTMTPGRKSSPPPGRTCTRCERRPQTRMDQHLDDQVPRSRNPLNAPPYHRTIAHWKRSARTLKTVRFPPRRHG